MQDFSSTQLTTAREQQQEEQSRCLLVHFKCGKHKVHPITILPYYMRLPFRNIFYVLFTRWMLKNKCKSFSKRFISSQYGIWGDSAAKHALEAESLDICRYIQVILQSL